MNNSEKPTTKIPRRKTQKGLRPFAFIFICFILFFSACKCPQLNYVGKYVFDTIAGKDPYVRATDNPDWALRLDASGLSNLHKVSDDLYRGAQPTEEGIQELQRMGIKTIINLRSDHSDLDIIKNTDIIYKSIPMTASNPKIEDDVFIVRQQLSAFNDNYNLEFIENLNDLINYAGGNYFNIINNT